MLSADGGGQETDPRVTRAMSMMLVPYESYCTGDQAGGELSEMHIGSKDGETMGRKKWRNDIL